MPRGGGAESQTGRATLGLRQLIYDGNLAPGERVREVDLSTQLGVSRTPLRIALATLAHEGLVDPLPGGGFVVRSLSPAEIFDAIELRGVLEGTAARLAAERHPDPDELVALEETCAALGEAVATLPDEDGLARYAELNEEFHAGLAALADSAPLTRALASNAALPFASPGALLASHAVLPGSLQILVVAQHQHETLVEAIRAGHGSRAEEIGREHARLARRNLELAIDHRPALEQVPGHTLLLEVA